MQGFVAVLTLKKDGIIEKELTNIKIEKDSGLLRDIYVVEEVGELLVRMFVTVEKKLEDWEFEALYDYYDMEVFEGLDLTINEAPGDLNPVWEINFPFIEETQRLEAKINGVLNLHGREAELALEAIAEAEGEYNDL